MNKKTKGAKNSTVTAYWLQFYSGVGCTLCGNHGTIDTTGLKWPDGREVGRRNFCFCPNGQALRYAYETPEEYDRQGEQADIIEGGAVTNSPE